MAAMGQPPPQQTLDMSTSVELSIKCKNLCDMDTFSKSDPMCVVFEKNFQTERWMEIGRTEVIWDNLNPEFVKKFVLKYHFEEMQKMKFEVYDIDSMNADLSKHDFLGRIEVSLGEIVSSGTLEKKLVGGPKHNKGSIIFRIEESDTCQDEITLEICGKKLDRKDIFGLSDPFLTFSRVNEDGSTTVCHRTEEIKNTLKPLWKRFTVPVRLLCNGDIDRQIYVKCYDWNKNGSHSRIGEFGTTVRELSLWPESKVYSLIHPDKKKKKSYTNSGTIHILFCEIVEVPSFLDFIQGGTELNCSIAIDFTASNGNPNLPDSLHYMSPYQPNQYSMALTSVGEIIQDYDSDNLFPALGFGAKIPPNGTISHCFPLNGSGDNPFCQGINGILEAYQNCVRQVQFYGPTNFAPCINHIASIARQHMDGTQFFILLILTDGIITDMPQTKEAIVEASTLPLAIIIVGVGNAEFDEMIELDGDDVRLSSNGKEAVRDIVQFVPFNNFVGDLKSGNLQLAKRQLAQEVLEEIPDQVVSFMRLHKIKPNRDPDRVNRHRRISVSSSASSSFNITSQNQPSLGGPSNFINTSQNQPSMGGPSNFINTSPQNLSFQQPPPAYRP